jgi:hypothetical protein
LTGRMDMVVHPFQEIGCWPKDGPPGHRSKKAHR